MFLPLKDRDIQYYFVLIALLIILSRISSVFASEEEQIQNPYEKLIEDEEVMKSGLQSPMGDANRHCELPQGAWSNFFGSPKISDSIKWVDLLPDVNYPCDELQMARNDGGEKNVIAMSAATWKSQDARALMPAGIASGIASPRNDVVKEATSLEVHSNDLATPVNNNIAPPVNDDSLIASFNDGKNTEEAVVALRINYADTAIVTTTLKTHINDILVPISDLNSFEIKQQYLELGRATIGGIDYVNLSKLPDIVYKLDEENLILTINFPPVAMPTQNISVWNESHRQAGSFGGVPIKAFFVNYDITSTRQDKQYYSAGIQEFNYANDGNVITQTLFTKRNFYGKDTSALTRLDTSLTMDNDTKMSSWRFGDSITVPADWSSSTRFAGVQYASDFSLNPSLVTYPLVNFSGRADLPTALDIYANSHLLYKTELKTGNFNMDNLPVSAGRGAVEIKQQDITGKMQTITIPYYVAPSMLKEGLKNFSYEVGTQRVGYGAVSNKYRYLVTSFDYNKGMTSNWTAGAHFESMKNIFAAGVNSLYKVGTYGVFSGSVATSGPKLSGAQKLLLGYSFQSQLFGVSLKQMISGRNFINVFNLDSSGVRRSSQASISYSLTPRSSIGLSYIRALSVSNGVQNTSETIMANYQNNMTKNSTLMFSVGTDMVNKGNAFVTLSFGYNLGANYLSSNVYKQGNSWVEQVGIASNAKTNRDLNYTANLTKDKQIGYDAQVRKQMQKVDTTLYLFNYANAPIQQISFDGAIAATSHGIFLSRNIDDSFVVAKVGDYNDVSVFHNNQLIGKTNKNGLIFIPKVPSHINSKIAIDEETLPLSASFTDNTFVVSPKRKSGVFAKFDIVKMRVGELTLLDSNHVPIAQDSDVKIEGVEDELFIGYDGKLYIADLHELTHIDGSACKDGHCCHFSVSLEGTENIEIIDLGVQRCE